MNASARGAHILVEARLSTTVVAAGFPVGGVLKSEL